MRFSSDTTERNPAAAPALRTSSLATALDALGLEYVRRGRETQALETLLEHVNAGLALNDLLARVAAGFHDLVPYDSLAIALLKHDGCTLRSRWPDPDASQQGWPSVPAHRGLLQRAADQKHPLIAENLTGSDEAVRRLLSDETVSSIVCPLVAEGHTVGFLFFCSRHPFRYDESHAHVAERIARRVALAGAETLLHEQAAEAHHVQKRFLSIVSHDLRARIGVIPGYVDLLLDPDHPSTPAETTAMLRTMAKASASMLSLIDDVMSLHRIEAAPALDLVELPMKSFLEDVVSGFAAPARRRSVALRLETPPVLPVVEIDAWHIRQATDNLISNALKFSKPGTAVIVRARVVEDFLEITVQDHGVGIPVEEVPRLFSLTERLRVRPMADEISTGLGLAIVKRSVEAHGGTVTAHSEVGVGSTFGFTLPLRQPH